MKRFSRRFRLLPAVILLGGGVLIMKSVSLVEDARAQTALTGQAAAPEPKDTTRVAVSDPVIDDSEANSAAEVEVLTSLSKRRLQLDAREKSLDMQSDLIAAAEQRVDGKIAMLKQLQVQMQTLLGQRDGAEQKELTDLVKSYSSMKPADAARIFNTLDDSVRLKVAAQMKSDVLGAILAKMQADPAETLTVELANRLKVPNTTPAALAAATTPEPPAAQQMASVDPVAPVAAAPAPAGEAAMQKPLPAANLASPQPDAGPKESAGTPSAQTAAPKEAASAAPSAASSAPVEAQTKPAGKQAKTGPAKQAATTAPAKSPAQAAPGKGG